MLRSSAITFPFSGGLSQKGDDLLQSPPALDKCVDAEFDDIGALRTRKPYAAVGIDILGGGTLSNIRKIVENDGELLCFTKDTLYSWNASASSWVAKGTHLACKTRETDPGCALSADDQVFADRAELSGVALYVWVNQAGVVSYAAADVASGSIVLQPQSLTSVSGCRAPRVVACQTKILFFYIDITAGWYVRSFDPATVTMSAATLIKVAPIGILDVVPAVGADAAVAVANDLSSGSGNYYLAYVTSALAVTTSTKAREADLITIAAHPGGARAQIVRTVGTSVIGDYVSIPALADVTVGQSLGAMSPAPQHLTAAYQSVLTGGAYRCYAFFGTNETTDTSVVTGFVPTVSVAWVDSSGSIGTASTFKKYVGIASRAFDVGGRVFVNVVFNGISEWTVTGAIVPNFVGALQNTYFLLRDDGFLTAKAVVGVAGGYQPTVEAATTLPGVWLSSDGSYRWLGTKRRALPLGVDSVRTGGAAPRHPVEISYSFDSNEARRSVRLGRTLYVAGGGEVLQYDGAQLVEVGQHVYPWRLNLADGGAGGNLSSGTYAYKMYWRWDSAQGERERSTTATIPIITVAASHTVTITGGNQNTLTHKTLSAAAAEAWRTVVNPTADSPFYLVTSTDPSTVSSAFNPYATNTPGTSATDMSDISDNYADATLATKESDSEASSLENLAPPAATIIVADANRLYLAGVANAPSVLWYSKQRGDGEIAAFNDALTVTLPAPGGAITGLGFLNETLIVFKATAVYALPGDGFDNTGGGSNYGPPRLLSSDCGAVNQESIALMEDGLIFKSSKGWYLLDRGWNVKFIGAPVSDYDAETPISVDVVTSQHQVRILTSARLLVWDTLVDQWGEWSIASGATSCLWNGAHVYATSSAVFQQRSDFAGVNYGMDVETAWFKPADPVGDCRVQWLMPLGEYKSACSLRIRISRNYQQDGSGNWVYFDDKYRTPATVVGGPLQVRIGPSIPNIEAIKVRLTATNVAQDGTAPTGEALKLSALGVEFGVRQGLYKRLAAAQKQ